MGSRLSTIRYEDCTGPGPTKDLSFFTSVRTKWLEYFIAKLNENSLSDLRITNTSETLSWRDYFRYFNEIKQLSEKDTEIKKRLSWHPATIGYLMQRDLQTVMEPEEVDLGPTDDYTEDEADSDLSDEEPDTSSEESEKETSPRDDDDEPKKPVPQLPPQPSQSRKKFIPPKDWNPHLINPIYFGYSQMTQEEHQETLLKNKIEIEKSERRAVEKAMASRSVALEEYETSIMAREKVRATKLEEMAAGYEKERQRRDLDLARNKKALPEMGFKMYRVSVNFSLSLCLSLCS
jgi:hypothetical protein